MRKVKKGHCYKYKKSSKIKCNFFIWNRFRVFNEDPDPNLRRQVFGSGTLLLG